MNKAHSDLSIYSAKPLYCLSGKVVHGRGIGKLVGTPTADIQLTPNEKFPPIGVYISILIWHSQKYASVTNIGNSPTLDTNRQISVETLILDFHTDIYGAQVELELLKFLRFPQNFKTLSKLRNQVFCDCEAARSYFKIPIKSSTVSHGTSSSLIQIGALYIDTQKRCALIQNQEIILTNKEFELLCLLCSHIGWAYSKEQLYEAIRHEPADGICHPVENLICQLRKKIKSYSAENIPSIKTIVGYGYKLVL